MITVKMQKLCGCFRKSSYEDMQTFENIEDAKNKANEICDDMNSNFCHKHKFISVLENNEITIKMSVNK